MRVAYVNGRWLAGGQAAVPVEDRGLLFADAIYEVCEVRGGRLVDAVPHLARLERSAAAIGLALPQPAAGFTRIMTECARRNRIAEGGVYLQVTRGHGFPRDFAPPKVARPNVICLAYRRGAGLMRARETGVSVITLPDARWRRPDIKSTSLLPNVLAKAAARAAGAWEAWLVDDAGFITEGASSNAWIVASGRAITRPTDGRILAGITRVRLLEAITAAGLKVEERAFSLNESQAADEAFGTAATALVMPVVRIDDSVIADGRPGPMVRKLQAMLVALTAP